MSTRNFAGTAEERRLTDQLEGFAGSSPDLAERPRPISPLDVPWSGPSLRNPTVDYASPLTLEQREESLPLLLTTTLVVRIISSSAWALLVSSFPCLIRTTSASCSASRRSQATTSRSNCLSSSRSSPLNIIRNTALKNERPWLELQVTAPAHTPMCRGRWRSHGGMSSPRDRYARSIRQ
jgi:hypothetical protein